MTFESLRLAHGLALGSPDSQVRTGVVEVLASLFLFGAAWPVPEMTAQAASAATQTLIENDADGLTRAANRMLGGIIAYVRWPDAPPGAPRTLCLAGTPRLTERIAPDMPGGGPVITVRRAGAADVGGGTCDILFLGRMAEDERRRWIGGLRGRPVLTITDDDPDCLRGAMFCLTARRGGLGFSVNLDAIGRGGLRVDPRVLKIGRDGGGAP